MSGWAIIFGVIAVAFAIGLALALRAAGRLIAGDLRDDA